MLTSLNKIITVILSFLLTIASVSSGLAVATDMEAYDSENIRLNFAAISDVHMKDEVARKGLLAAGLKDLSRSDTQVNALVITGDLTDDGEASSYNTLYSTLSGMKKDTVPVLATGNHDTWGDSGYDDSMQCFKSGYSELTGEQIENVYYYKVINGYYIIVLGSEKENGCPAYFSDTQLEWLDSTLRVATSEGKPAFVLCHQPLNDTHGVPYVWDNGQMGEQSDRVKTILTSYNNVFLLSGHIHNGFSEGETGDIFKYNTVESSGSFHSINLPVFTYFNSRGIMMDGSGFMFEVYDTEVVIRARCFTASYWVDEYEYHFEII